MDQHEKMVLELFEHKSVEALIWLSEAGRELEFRALGRMCFMTCDGSAKCVSVWDGKNWQHYDSVIELTKRAIIAERPFAEAWNDAEIATLF